MKNEIILQLKSRFDSLVQKVPESDVEFWYARELMDVLGYDRWENFSNVIEKAITACKNSGAQVENHFRDATKMVIIGSGAASWFAQQSKSGRKRPVPSVGRRSVRSNNKRNGYTSTFKV